MKSVGLASIIKTLSMVSLHRRVALPVSVVAILSIFTKYRLRYLGMSPITYVLPDLPDLLPDSRLGGGVINHIGEGDLIGPESFVVSKDPIDGFPVLFAALADGRVVRIRENVVPGGMQWTTVVRTGEESNDRPCGGGGPADRFETEESCGRPLGIIIVKASTVADAPFFAEDSPRVDDDDDVVLVVADAYAGLLIVTGIYGDRAEKRVLAARADVDPEENFFRLLNGIVQAPDGSIYVTETSQTFRRRRIFFAALDGRPTGRLLRYRKGRGVEVVVDSIFMPNGITLSHSKEALLIISGVQVLRYSLETMRMDDRPFVRVLPGTGDNIKAFDFLPTGEARRCFYLGLGSKFARPFSFLKAVSERPMVRSLVLALVPYWRILECIPKFTAIAVYDEGGSLIETYQDPSAEMPWLSEAEPMGEHIYLGSWYAPFLGRVRREDLVAATSSYENF